MPELVEYATMEAIRIRAKWENDDYIYKGHILNGMSDSLFDVYTNVKSAKELWDSFKSKYMAENSSIIEFGDSYKAPTNSDPVDSRRKDAEQSGRTVTVTTEDMQKKKNDVKARINLLLSLPDEHQLRDVEVEKDDLNQKFLTSLAPECLRHTIVWRNRNDLDSMSLDDLYNHLKVY
nr:zinc finger, CCHC-type [Tanacetum cinerariifolium]